MGPIVRRRSDWWLVLAILTVVSCGEGPDAVGFDPAASPAFAPGGNRPATTFVKLRPLTLDNSVFVLESLARSFGITVDNPGPARSSLAAHSWS